MCFHARHLTPPSSPLSSHTELVVEYDVGATAIGECVRGGKGKGK